MSDSTSSLRPSSEPSVDALDGASAAVPSTTLGECFQAAVEGAAEGVQLYELESSGQWVFLAGNARASKLLGSDGEALARAPIGDTFPSLANSEVLEAFHRVLRSGQSWQSERVVLSGDDGEPVTATLGAFRVAPTKLVVVISEATGRLVATADALSPEARYRLIIENQTDLLMQGDAEGRLSFASESFARLMGSGDAQLVGCGFQEHVQLEDRAATYAALERLHSPPHACYFEHRLATRSGPRWIAWQARALLDEVGDFVGFTGVGRDISEQKAATTALQEQQHRLEMVLDATGVALWDIDLEERTARVDERIWRMVGEQPRGSVVALEELWDRIHPDDVAAFRAEVAKHYAGQTMQIESEHRLAGGEGEWIWVLLRGKATEWGPNGQPRRVVGTQLDVTERKAAEHQRQVMQGQLFEAQKLESLGGLAGGIAHDFNNLLSGILGSVELSLLELPEGHAVRCDLERARTTAYRAAELCSQLVAYSGKGQFSRQPVDLSRLVAEMADLIRASISKKVRLHLLLAPSLPVVSGDAVRFRQVVLNLVVNGAEAIGEGVGELTIRTGVEPESEGLPAELASRVFIEVEDSGCGMDEETRRRMFDPFFSTKFTGRGLGLSAVSGIVRAHEGELVVESAPDRGTKVRIQMPSSGYAEERTRSPEAPANWRGEGVVLLVDDESAVREVGTRLLEHLGFEVLTAENGRRAITMFEENSERISVVLLDVTMPELGGREALAEIARIDPNVPVVLCSGYLEQDVLARGGEGKISGFLQKPFHLERVREVVSAALCAE